jgi:hypothetical protein
MLYKMLTSFGGYKTTYLAGSAYPEIHQIDLKELQEGIHYVVISEKKEDFTEQKINKQANK